MRLVSGYARKIKTGSPEKDPRRVIQIIDLDKNNRVLLYPETKTFSAAPLGEIDYGNKMAQTLKQPGPLWRIVSREMELKKERHTRTIMETECGHYRINVAMRLEGPQGRQVSARMDQHVWVAPITGELSTNVLDLIAFENDYRARTSGELSPLDHQRYQVKEAAGYLRVDPKELKILVEDVRRRLQDLPSYPVASSVSWWRDEEQRKRVALGDVKPKDVSAPGPTQEKRPAPPKKNRPVPIRRRFKNIDWRRDEGKINKMYSRTRSQVGGFGPLRMRQTPLLRPQATATQRNWQEPSIYPKFEKELQSVLNLLIKEQEENFETPPAPDGPSEGRSQSPFYEIYTEMYGLEIEAKIPTSDFLLPKDYKEVPYFTKKD